MATAPLKLLLCVWGTALLSAVEQSAVAPSMWLYLKDLGGDQAIYSIALAAFLGGRMAALPLVGIWADRRPSGEILRSMVCLGLLASLLYSLGAWFGNPWPAVLGRGLLGVASTVSVATTTFVARHTTKDDRTRYIGINSVLSNGMKVCGPGLNVLFVLLPAWDPPGLASRITLFGPLTDPGWFLALAHVAALVALAVVYEDPPQAASGRNSGAAKRQLRARDALGHLWGSGAWVCWVMTAQNNFSWQTMVWALPIMTDRALRWGELQNSYLSGAMALVGIGAALLISCAASRRYQDRHIILWNQVIAGSGFLPLAVLGGCHVAASFVNPAVLVVVGALVWTVGFQGQVPGNMGLYSKLVGSEHFGFYQSLFMMVMTCSRTACSCLIGLVDDLCPVWLVASTLWLLQWVALGAMWRKLQPEAYEAYHERRSQSGSTDISVPSAAISLVGEGRVVAPHGSGSAAGVAAARVGSCRDPC